MSTQECSKIRDLNLLNVAKQVSLLSKDPSTKCGAVIVLDDEIISCGFNKIPSNFSSPEEILKDRDRKLAATIHAEMIALLDCSLRTITGATMYVYPMQPCTECAKHIIYAGITRVVTLQISGDRLDRWSESFTKARRLFNTAGVSLQFYENCN